MYTEPGALNSERMRRRRGFKGPNGVTAQQLRGSNAACFAKSCWSLWVTIRSTRRHKCTTSFTKSRLGLMKSFRCSFNLKVAGSWSGGAEVTETQNHLLRSWESLWTRTLFLVFLLPSLLSAARFTHRRQKAKTLFPIYDGISFSLNFPKVNTSERHAAADRWTSFSNDVATGHNTPSTDYLHQNFFTHIWFVFFSFVVLN